MKVNPLLPRHLRAGLALCFALAVAPLSQAVVITLNNHFYDVTTIVAYETDPLLRTTPWWYENAGSQGNTLALSAAQQVGSAFGATYVGYFGPFFSWKQSNNASYTTDHTLMMIGGFGPMNQVTWAVATEVPAPAVPDTAATIGLLGLAATLLVVARRRTLRV
ncbi:MAG: hypothetical protein HZC55_07710 [Verrucomicrobia bacterium]|nr:hypothetical protein [Verrucomicrobiota bacterium]